MSTVHTLSNVEPIHPTPPVTLRDAHNGFCDELERLLKALRAKPVPPRPCAYASAGELAGLFEDQSNYLSEVTKALRPLFERVGIDAADYGGAREPDFDDVQAVVEEDFIAPIRAVVEEER